MMDATLPWLSAIDLFNKFNHESFIMIDTRETSDFAHLHIVQSVNVPISLSSVEDIGTLMESLPPCKLKDILAKRSNRLIIFCQNDELAMKLHAAFMAENKVSSCHFLEGEVDQFGKAYPFLMATGHGEEYVKQYPNHIIPGLYLGTKYHAIEDSVRLDLGITHVVSVVQPFEMAVTTPWTGDGVKYCNIHVNDQPGQDMGHAFAESVAFVREAKAGVREAVVLVHCAMGISRSASVVMNLLMSLEHMTLKAAYTVTQQRRQVVCPNPGFMRQLMDAEVALFGSNSTNGEELTGVQPAKPKSTCLIM